MSTRQRTVVVALLGCVAFQTAQSFVIRLPGSLGPAPVWTQLCLSKLASELMPMDVVVFSGNKREKKMLGAIQDDGKLAPLSAWTTEFAFEESVEFVVDEEDLPGHDIDEDEDVVIHSIVPESLLSYGSRQVGGGKGPGNPHGEESENLYYIDSSILEGIEIEVNPGLEILW